MHAEFQAAGGFVLIKVSLPPLAPLPTCDLRISCIGCYLQVTSTPVVAVSADTAYVCTMDTQQLQCPLSTAVPPTTLSATGAVLFAFAPLTDGYFFFVAGNVWYADNAAPTATQPAYGYTPTLAALQQVPEAWSTFTTPATSDCTAAVAKPLLVLVQCREPPCALTLMMYSSVVRSPSLLACTLLVWSLLSLPSWWKPPVVCDDVRRKRRCG